MGGRPPSSTRFPLTPPLGRSGGAGAVPGGGGAGVVPGTGRDPPPRSRAHALLVAFSAFEGDYAPEPLTVEVQVQLSQCRSAEEAFRLMPP